MNATDAQAVDALLETASTAITALQAAAQGKEPEDPANTDVSTLLALSRLIEGLVADLQCHRAEQARLLRLLGRISALEVRGAQELIEAGNWKKLCAELQAIAEQG